LSFLEVFVLDLLIGRVLNAIVKNFNAFMSGVRNHDDFHFVTKVTLRNQPLVLLVDLVHEVVIDVNVKVLSFMHHLHEDTCALKDGLVVADVGKACHEIFNSKLFFQLESENSSFVKQLHIDVDFLFNNFVKNVLNDIKLMFMDSILELCLILVDLIVTSVAAADWSFFDGS